MQNLVQPGNTLTVVSPANVASGEGVVIGSIFGVAAGAVQTGQPLDLTVEGVFDLPKASASVFTVGEPVYWHISGKQAASTNDSNSLGDVTIGYAVAPAGVGQSTVRVRLVPSV